MQAIRRHIFKCFEPSCTIKKEIIYSKSFTVCCYAPYILPWEKQLWEGLSLKQNILRNKLMNR